MLKPLALLAATLPAPLAAQTLWQEAGARVETVIYRCDNGFDDLTVAYFTAADASSFAALQIGGHVHALVQQVSASGVRYGDIEQDGGYRIHGKGDLLMLSRQTTDDATGEQRLAHCTAQRR
jgi:membrane-bound inhibitor of C-type lysozyme